MYVATVRDADSAVTNCVDREDLGTAPADHTNFEVTATEYSQFSSGRFHPGSHTLDRWKHEVDDTFSEIPDTRPLIRVRGGTPATKPEALPDGLIRELGTASPGNLAFWIVNPNGTKDNTYTSSGPGDLITFTSIGRIRIAFVNGEAPLILPMTLSDEWEFAECDLFRIYAPARIEVIAKDLQNTR